MKNEKLGGRVVYEGKQAIYAGNRSVAIAPPLRRGEFNGTLCVPNEELKMKNYGEYSKEAIRIAGGRGRRPYDFTVGIPAKLGFFSKIA
jgi:hypothetical protein